MAQTTKSAPSGEPLLPRHGGYRRLKSFQLSQLVYDITVRFCDRYISKYSRTHDQMVQAARSGVQNIAEGSQASGTSRKTELKLTNVARASLEELKLDYEDFLRQKGYALWAADEPLRQALVQRRCSTADEVAAWVKEVRAGWSRQSGQRAESGRVREQDGQGGRCGLDGQDGHGGQDGQDGHGNHDGRNGLYGHNGHDGQSVHAAASGESISSIPSISSIKSIPSIQQTPSTPHTPAVQPTSPTSPTYSEIAANAALVLIGVATFLLDRQLKAQADTFLKEGGFTEKLYKTRQNSRTQN